MDTSAHACNRIIWLACKLNIDPYRLLKGNVILVWIWKRLELKIAGIKSKTHPVWPSVYSH